MVTHFFKNFNCSDCVSSEDISNPLSPEGKLLNMKCVFNAHIAGISHSWLNDITATMDMLPPISQHFFSRIKYGYWKVSIYRNTEHMLEATHRLHDHLGFEREKEIDVRVTVGGSWHKRSYSSNHGLVAVISWDTGEAAVITLCPSFMAFD